MVIVLYILTVSIYKAMDGSKIPDLEQVAGSHH